MESGVHKRQAAVTTDINVTHGLKGAALTEVGYTRSRPEQRDAIDRIVIQIIALVRGIILEGGIVWKAFSKSVGHSQREQT